MFIYHFGLTGQKGVHAMADTINVCDLPEEDVRILELWVERLRAKVKRQRQAQRERKEAVDFTTWPLGVKGKLTREEIYDYL
jgi:hypothetical protein